MKPNPWREIAMASILFVPLAGCADAASRSGEGRKAPDAEKTGVRMTRLNLNHCEARAATLVLIEENLLTRTAVTAETAARYAKPVELAPGDPRLARLNTVLRDLALEAPVLKAFEPRLVLRLQCADGETLIVTGSKTVEDGVVNLEVNGESFRTRGALRRELEQLVGR